MKAKLGYCDRCNREVRLISTDVPLHGGQPPLPDAPQLICLDCGDACKDAVCSVTNLSHSVMEKRLEQFERDK